MRKMTKQLGIGCLLTLLTAYFMIGVFTAIVMGVVSETSNEPDAWWANSMLCVVAWPVIWTIVVFVVVTNS